MTGAPPHPELTLRSTDATWDAARWETLGEDGNRYEVIAGVLYMTTAPSPFHQWVSRQVGRLLYAQLDDRGLGLTLAAPVGLFMPGCDPVQPDLFVLRPEDATLVFARRITAVPLLIVEILSPSNPDHDLVLKRGAYARASVPEYWVARPDERDVLVHSEPDAASGQYTRVARVASGAILASPTLLIRTTVADLFAGPASAPSGEVRPTP